MENSWRLANNEESVTVNSNEERKESTNVEFCQLCNKVYNDNIRPHCLICNYNFCTECLNNSVVGKSLVCPVCEKLRHPSIGGRGESDTQSAVSRLRAEQSWTIRPIPKLIIFSSDIRMLSKVDMYLCLHISELKALTLQMFILYKEAAREIMPRIVEELAYDITNLVVQKDWEQGRLNAKDITKTASLRNGCEDSPDEIDMNGIAEMFNENDNTPQSVSESKYNMTDDGGELGIKECHNSADNSSCLYDQEVATSSKAEEDEPHDYLVFSSDQGRETQLNLVLEVYIKRPNSLPSDVFACYKEATCKILSKNIPSIVFEIVSTVVQKETDLSLEMKRRTRRNFKRSYKKTQNGIAHLGSKTKTKNVITHLAETNEAKNWREERVIQETDFGRILDLESILANFIKNLETDIVYTHWTIDKAPYSAKITNEDDKLYLYSLVKAKPPSSSRIAQHGDLMRLLDGKQVTTFMDLQWEGHTQGRVHFKIIQTTSLSRNFRSLCTGEFGLSFVGSRLLEVLGEENRADEAVLAGYYEHNLDVISRSLLEDDDVEDDSTECNGGPGSVWAGYGSIGRPVSFQFGVTTGKVVQPDRTGNIFGEVDKDSLLILQEAARIPDIRSVRIVNCGILLPLSHWEFHNFLM